MEGSQAVTIGFAPTSAIDYNGTLTVNGDQTIGMNTIGMGIGDRLVSLRGIATGGGARITTATVTILDGSNVGRSTTTTNSDYRLPT